MLFFVIPTAGVTSSTLLALLALAGSAGTSEQVIRDLAGLNSDVLVTTAAQNHVLCDLPQLEQRIRTVGHIRAIAPYIILAQVSVRNDPDSAPIVFAVKGIDAFAEAATTTLLMGTSRSELESFYHDDGPVPLLVGERLGRKIANKDETLTLAIPDPIQDNLFAGKVTGTFRAPGALDVSWAFAPIHKIRELTNTPSRCFQGVAIRTDRPKDASAISKRIQARLGVAYRVTSWTETYPSYWAGISLLNKLITGLDGIVVLFVCFVSLSIILLIVNEKRRDAAILLTLGFSTREIRLIFVAIAVGLTAVGSIVATVVAFPTATFLTNRHVFKIPSHQLISHLSFTLSWTQTIQLCTGVVFLSAILGWWFSADVDSVPVAEILRDE